MRQTFGWFATATSVATRHSPAMREMSVTEQRYTSALAPSMGFEPRDVLEMPHFLIGIIQQIEADLKLRRERYGFSDVIIPGNTAEQLAPVVERFAGN